MKFNYLKGFLIGVGGSLISVGGSLISGCNVGVTFGAIEQTRYKDNKEARLKEAARLEVPHHSISCELTPLAVSWVYKNGDVSCFFKVQSRKLDNWGTVASSLFKMRSRKVNDWGTHDTTNKNLSKKFIDAHNNYSIKNTRIEGENQNFIEFVNKPKNPFLDDTMLKIPAEQSSMSAFVTDEEVIAAQSKYQRFLEQEQEKYQQTRAVPSTSTCNGSNLEQKPCYFQATLFVTVTSAILLANIIVLLKKKFAKKK